ncbi:MAG TPA: lamin tail domain-containing protein [bacterium]|mgnify:FL=1|nr:lamin tail domain-containing protein [bacterium]HQH80656.1 lamin tail domain-containing protein [bacterium]
MKRSIYTGAVILLIFLFSGCGGVSVPDISMLSDSQPRVVSVFPERMSFASPYERIEIEFSEPVYPDSIDSKSVVVVEAQGEESDEDISESAIEGDLIGRAGRFHVSDDGKVVSFESLDPYHPGEYAIVVTRLVFSEKLVPLSQNPVRIHSPFVSRFIVSEGGEGWDGSHSPGETSPSGGGSYKPAPPERPSYLVINEILYDVPGVDTNGNVFIELFGEPNKEISGYAIYLANGDDGAVKDTIRLPAKSIIPDDGIFLIADAKTGSSRESFVEGANHVENFDPQNGPDCAILVDASGRVVDALGYGDVTSRFVDSGLPCLEGEPAPRVPAGSSLSRVGGADSDDNLSDFVTLPMPTPGIL